MSYHVILRVTWEDELIALEKHVSRRSGTDPSSVSRCLQRKLHDIFPPTSFKAELLSSGASC